MDEKDGAFSNDFNKLSLNRDDNFGSFSSSPEMSSFGSPVDFNKNGNGFGLYDPENVDSEPDTTDSMHKDIFSKLSLG